MEDFPTVEFTDTAYKDIVELAYLMDTSVPNVLDEAIGLQRWRVQIEMQGGRVLGEDKNGKLYELVKGE